MNDYWIDIISNISSSILLKGFTVIIDGIFIGIVVTVVAIIVLLKSSPVWEFHERVRTATM